MLSHRVNLCVEVLLIKLLPNLPRQLGLLDQQAPERLFATFILNRPCDTSKHDCEVFLAALGPGKSNFEQIPGLFEVQ